MPTAKKKPKAKSKARKPAPKAEPPKQVTVWQQRFASLKAKYDAAQIDNDNVRHWRNADSLSAAEANSATVRQTLRDRSRFEAANNGYYAGIIRTHSDDMVGTGPKPQIPIENDELAKAIEQAWSAWAKAVRLVEKLHTLDQAKLRDGEAFALLATNERVANPVKLDVVPVEADRFADPRFRMFETVGDGITYDSAGNPLSYTVLREYPSSRLAWSPAPEFDVIPAEFVCHWYRCDRPGQLRGVPELTASLPIMAIARRWTLATVLAAETAANFAVLLETQANPASETQPTPPDPFETLDIERNMMTALPVGVKANQMKSENPNAEYQNFKWEMLGEQCRPIRMPVNVAAGDTSRANFASAKIDHLGYRAGLRVDRGFCESQALDRIYPIWFREAKSIAGLLPAEATVDLPVLWTWPGWLSWDKNEAKSDTEMLNNNTTTLAELMAEAGQDWREVLQQRAKELELMDELGIAPTPAPSPFGSAPQRPAGDGQDVPTDPLGEDGQPTAPMAAHLNRLKALGLNGHRRARQ